MPPPTTPPPRTQAKFQPGWVPQEIALKSIEGQRVNSRYDGDQAVFILTTGQRWYTDLYTAQTLEQMMIQPGEFFQVTKVRIRAGNNRSIERVEIKAVVNPEPAPPPPKQPKSPAIPSSQNGTAGTNHQGQINGSGQSNPSTSRSPAPASLPPPPMNGHGETSAMHLTRCYRDAVNIALATVDYAKEKGLSVAPQFSDLRALAATIAISEGGRR